MAAAAAAAGWQGEVILVAVSDLPAAGGLLQLELRAPLDAGLSWYSSASSLALTSGDGGLDSSAVSDYNDDGDIVEHAATTRLVGTEQGYEHGLGQQQQPPYPQPSQPPHLHVAHENLTAAAPVVVLGTQPDVVLSSARGGDGGGLLAAWGQAALDPRHLEAAGAAAELAGLRATSGMAAAAANEFLFDLGLLLDAVAARGAVATGGGTAAAAAATTTAADGESTALAYDSERPSYRDEIQGWMLGLLGLAPPSALTCQCRPGARDPQCGRHLRPV